MIDVSASVDISRPLEEVFKFMTDLQSLPLWLEGVKKAESLSPRPDVVGARVRHDNEFMGQAFESTFEVVAWEPNASVVFEVRGGPLRGESRESFERLADGSTRVSIRVTGDGTGILRFGNLLAGITAKRQLERSLATAKRLLEGAS